MTRADYTLYARHNAGSLAPQIVLEEIGAPYQLAWIGSSPAEVESYRRINPNAKIPALMLPDGTTVYESAAILIHLTDAHPAAGLAPAAGSARHALFLQWMVSLSANVYEALLRYYYADRYSTGAASAADGIQAQALKDYDRHLELVHDSLRPYVLGADFTAADPYLYMLASWYPGGMAAFQTRLPRLARHAELVRARPATRKAEEDHTER
ncbi:MAG: glutathione S-transferase family protein [Proteobacteria bacterium]|nr:glutathione S-transferase family protein [Pseudomonadota bacterium]